MKKSSFAVVIGIMLLISAGLIVAQNSTPPPSNPSPAPSNPSSSDSAPSSSTPAPSPNAPSPSPSNSSPSPSNSSLSSSNPAPSPSASSPSSSNSSSSSSGPFTPPNFPVPTFDQSRTYNVMDFGATGQGGGNDTEAINKAIEKCNADGGGSVIFPAGTYMAASIHIMSNVQSLLEKPAVIKGLATGYDPPEPNEYEKYQDVGHSHYHDSLLWGEDIENFAIIGGTIDGGAITEGTPRPNGGDKQIA